MKNDDLFNIEILVPTAQEIKSIGRVTKLNIYSSGANFEEEGLFSTSIFNQVGSKERNVTFGYIDLGVTLMHPIVYQHVINLGTLYKDVIYGKKRVRFDTTVEDLVEDENGGTGLYFFLKYATKIKYKETESDKRDFKIEMVTRYAKEDALIRYLLILPAGLRDYIVKDNKPSEDEINDIYRSMLAMANTFTNIKITERNAEDFNAVIVKMQKLFLVIYEHFKIVLMNKKGFIQNKWSKRAIKYGLRNVITPINNLSTSTDTDNNISFNDTAIGLWQYINGISPITKHLVTNMFINRILDPSKPSVILFDKNLKPVSHVVKPKTMREWTTFEGLDTIMYKLGQDDLRYDPIMLDGHYPLLVKDNGNTIRIYFPTDDIPTNEKLRPITYMEFFYIAVYQVCIMKKYPAMLTRYPITGVGSTYMTNLVLKTSLIGRTISHIQIGDEDIHNNTVMYNYPVFTEKPFNSISPHYTKLTRLGGDFDGDEL